MLNISIAQELKDLCPDLRLACLLAKVKTSDTSDDLLSEIQRNCRSISLNLLTEDISKMPAIRSARNAYKACGKDPARYRLSAEALLRRIASGKNLYSINNTVDQLNLVSVLTGISIGGYDFEKISGKIEFGIGLENEVYSGIGKGELNIANLPVFRDEIGAFGSPTSDSQRTMVSSETVFFLMIFIDFSSDVILNEAILNSQKLLLKYCESEIIKLEIVK